MRVRNRFTALVALAFFAAPRAVSAADDPLVMAPSSDWVMDYAEQSCALRRAFAGGGHGAVLELRDHGGGGDFLEITVVSETLGVIDGTPRVAFEPGESPVAQPSARLLGNRERGGLRYFGAPLATARNGGAEAAEPLTPQQRQARAGEITALLVAERFERPIRLETGRLDRALAAMEVCTDDLLASRGIDPAVLRTLSRHARPLDQAAWARRVRDGTPLAVIRQSRGGEVVARVVVGPDGRVADCHADGPSSPELQAEACRLMRRHARYEPALDAAGNPVASPSISRIIYGVER